MNVSPAEIPVYHITDVENLSRILASGGLFSDVAMVAAEHTVIGYNHIKERRMKEIRIPCCAHRFVGEFVPFYYFPRSPMLYTLNRGKAGRPAGCQTSVVHLVSTVGFAIDLERQWAISDGNAGAFHTSFYSDLAALETLDWAAIRATDWRGRTHEKSAEVLVADFFPWPGFHTIGCRNREIANQVENLLHGQPQAHRPSVAIEPQWYY